MAKFETRLVEKDKTWTAEITRKISARKSKVTMSKGDFATEKDASDWAEAELKTLAGKVSKRRRDHKAKKDVINNEKKKEKQKAEEIKAND